MQEEALAPAAGGGGGGVASVRPLCPGDEPAVRLLCADSFPIVYPDNWYAYITSDRAISRAVFSECGELLAMIVAELQPLAQLEGDCGAALEAAARNTAAMYIISLGVLTPHRHKGLGSLLLRSLLAHASTIPRCKVVFLHVVFSNLPAINFYRRHDFQEFRVIRNYYHINSTPTDGLLYLCYINGGEPFSGGASSYWRRYVVESSLCEGVGLVCGCVCSALRRGWARMWRTKHYWF